MVLWCDSCAEKIQSVTLWSVWNKEQCDLSGTASINTAFTGEWQGAGRGGLQTGRLGIASIYTAFTGEWQRAG